jgi:phosphoglycolate phosphatase-like HAD superfamily hydrolase
VLVLWDVDHTLVDAGGVGLLAFRAAFRELFGREMVVRPALAGRTDLAIITEVLQTNGVPDPAPYLEDFRLAAEDALVGLQETLRTTGRALPGAVDVLAALRADGVAQTLLTGNIRAFAEAKMRTFGLAGYLDLDIGAYGWSHVVRANLVDLARAAARERYGRAYPGPATVLVGDTPRDVEAALATGAAIVAVATGQYGADELRAAGAGVVLPDLTDTAATLTAIRATGLAS